MKATKIWFDEFVNIELDDGRTGRLPLTDFPRLKHATDVYSFAVWHPLEKYR